MKIKTPIDHIRAIIRIRPLITDTQTNTLDWQWLLMPFAALDKADPLISTTAHQKFDLDLWPSSMNLIRTFDLDLKAE